MFAEMNTWKTEVAVWCCFAFDKMAWHGMSYHHSLSSRYRKLAVWQSTGGKWVERRGCLAFFISWVWQEMSWCDRLMACIRRLLWIHIAKSPAWRCFWRIGFGGIISSAAMHGKCCRCTAWVPVMLSWVPNAFEQTKYVCKSAGSVRSYSSRSSHLYTMQHVSMVSGMPADSRIPAFGPVTFWFVPFICIACHSIVFIRCYVAACSYRH